VIALTQPLPEDGNAVEFAQPGDNNALIGNTFTRYSDTAVTVSGNRQTIRDNKFLSNKNDGLRAVGTDLLIQGNTFIDNGGSGVIAGGAGTLVLNNVVSDNEGRGVVVSSAGVTVSRNSVFNNGHLGIDVAAPGGGRGGVGRGGAGRGGSGVPGGRGAAGGRQAPAAAGPPAGDVSTIPAAPELAGNSAWTSNGIVLNGSLKAKPDQTYRIEVYASRSPDRHAGEERGWGEGERSLAMTSITCNSNGEGAFTINLDLTDPLGNGQSTDLFTATATDSSGSTSKFSRALSLTRN
jgi:parallel beta-helix repeat protein